MKGNQGLEALAALCGGRRKAIDFAGTGPVPAPAASATINLNVAGSPASTVARAKSSPVGTEGKDPSSEAVTDAGNTHISKNSDATSVAGSNGSHVSVTMQQQQQQHVRSNPTGNTPPVAAALNAIALGNLTPQQISQAIVTAANGQNGRLDPAISQSLLIPGGIRTAVGGVETAVSPTAAPIAAANNNNALANTMQQLLIQQFLQAQVSAQQQAQQQQQKVQAQAAAAAAAAASSGNQQAAFLAMALAAAKAGQHQHLLSNVTPATTRSTTSTGSSHINSGSQQQAQTLQLQQQVNQIQHPQTVQQQYHYNNNDRNTSLPTMLNLAAPGGRILPSMETSDPMTAVANSTSDKGGTESNDSLESNVADNSAPGTKKQQKRAANRRSAQLSRKRKKQFIEELKEENDDLRRKEQILRAIPDLIVVFDSSGKLGFVSESLGRFLDVSPETLEGGSFWDLICQDSVRLLKAAFMDSLAAREADCDTAELGSGVWELRLKNKDLQYMPVTLNGVVHFKGEAPECVCCIRPLGEQQRKRQEQQHQAQSSSPQKPKPTGIERSDGSANAVNNKNNRKTLNRPVSCSDGDASRSSEGSNRTQQSVLNSRHGHAHELSLSSAPQGNTAQDKEQRNIKFRRMMASADDGGTNSGSDDGSSSDKNADGTNNSIRISDGSSNDGVESD